MGIGSIGFTEIMVIAVIVLIFFGPQRLPEISRALGGAMREFRRSMNEIQRELEEVDRVRKWQSAAPSQPAGASPEASAEELDPPIAGATTGSPPHATVPVDAVTPAPPEEMTGEAPAGSDGDGEPKLESPAES
jgi:sec-independent protein translocase protein TatA